MPKKETIVRYTSEELASLPKPDIDWKRIDALTDADIEQAIQDDPDAAPILDAEFFKAAELIMPLSTKKKRITMMVNESVLDYFQIDGKDGYQSRMNAILEAYVKTEMRRKTQEA